jgi:hypothetical protein
MDKNYKYSKEELQNILNGRLLVSILGIFTGIVIITIISMSLSGVIHFKLMLWHVLIACFVGMFSIQSIKVIVDYEKVDVDYSKCISTQLMIDKKFSQYYFSFINEKGEEKQFYLGIPEGSVRLKKEKIPQNTELYLYYTKRSHVFIGLKYLDKNNEFRDVKR